MSAPGVATRPHLMVTWSNAITTRPGTSECFADRGDGLAAAGDGRRPWNNTRVDLAWHEAHGRIAERKEIAGQPHRHTWGVACRPCNAAAGHRRMSEDEVTAARDAAGDHHLHAVTS